MSDIGEKNSKKYLEGNYSKNIFEAFFQKQEDEKQALELSTIEEYMKDYMKSLKAQREAQHYLVDGAILRCTHCTMEPVTISGLTFTAPMGSDEVVLKVTNNQYFHNDMGQYFATIKDSDAKKNINPFGNCKNPPDRADEKEAIELAGTSAELRKLGTCRYLRKLNAAWENLISDVGYEEVTGLENSLLEEITMESILFCQHGGLIYPVDPGYIVTEVDETELTLEEKAFAEAYGLTEEQCQALFDIRAYLEEHPELGIGTTIFAFEGLGIKLGEGETSSWNGRNSYHPDGQFGAILIVTKDGQLSYAETRASTLPDNMETSATVKEGIYSVHAVSHPLSGGYAAVRLKQFGSKDDYVLPAYNSVHGNGTADGINLHMAGVIRSDNPLKPYSAGCITIAVEGYRNFGVATGFIEDCEETVNVGSDGDYKDAKKELEYDENSVKDFQGSIVAPLSA